jgi:hypothetical protein
LKFEAGSDYCVLLGNVGFALVLLSLTYPLRKSFPRFFKRLGRKPLWLDFHNFCGIAGTVLVFFHTGLTFPLTVAKLAFVATLACFSLALVTLSGIFGRFLYMAIPRGVAGTELKMRDIEEEDAALTQKLDALFEGSSKHRDLITRIVASLTQQAVNASSVWSLVRAVIRTRFLLWKLRYTLPRELQIHGRQIKVFLDLLAKKIRLARNVAFLGLSSRLFVRWQYVHRLFAYTLGALVISHVIYNVLFYAWAR